MITIDSQIITLENCQIIEINSKLMVDTINLLRKYRTFGIGGRDALILAYMESKQVKTILTHDKNILSLNQYNRIDPVFDPPLERKIGQKFDRQEFKIRLSNL